MNYAPNCEDYTYLICDKCNFKVCRANRLEAVEVSIFEFRNYGKFINIDNDDKSESCWNDYLFFKCLKCDYCICYPKIEHENSIVKFLYNKNTYYNISNSLKYAHYNKNLNLTCEEIQIKNIIE